MSFNTILRKTGATARSRRGVFFSNQNHLVGASVLSSSSPWHHHHHHHHHLLATTSPTTTTTTSIIKRINHTISSHDESSRWARNNPLDPHNKSATFFDMVHSNNGARVRLWLRCSPDESILDKEVELTMLTYADLQTPDYKKINPFQKIPSLIMHSNNDNEDDNNNNDRDAEDTCLYESAVILSYLEDKYHNNQVFVPTSSPELRQQMDLTIRLHDLYVSSPNCTAPGFSHSQGAMYLAPTPTLTTPARRVMSCPKTRSAKIAELWKQLQLLNQQLEQNFRVYPNSNFIVGDQLSLADFTWFPTTIFMQFMLPKVFGWTDVFDPPPQEDNNNNPLPFVSRWWKHLRYEHSEFAKVHQEIWDFWQIAHDEKNHFDTIKQVVSDRPDYQWKYPVAWDSDTTQALLHYQQPPTSEEVQVGRYIQQPPKDDLIDVHDIRPVTVHNARKRTNDDKDVPLYHVEGFELVNSQPDPLLETSTEAFQDQDLVVSKYYDEMRTIVKNVTGCSTVGVFDHTLRTSSSAAAEASGSSSASLNATDASQYASTVQRVHSDYSEISAPRRLEQLIQAGTLLGDENQPITQDQIDGILFSSEEPLFSSDEEEPPEGNNNNEQKRFAMVNVWRSIDPHSDIMTDPLVVCDARTVPSTDLLRYQMRFPDRTGENFAVKYNPQHVWYMYPRMTQRECLVFAAYDSHHPQAGNNNNKNDANTGAANPFCVFHTSIVDPRGDHLNPPPPRQSIEVRTVAIWD